MTTARTCRKCGKLLSAYNASDTLCFACQSKKYWDDYYGYDEDGNKINRPKPMKLSASNNNLAKMQARTTS